MEQNQIMRYIIYYNNSTSLEILTMHIRCKKGVIALIRFMELQLWNNVEVDHYAFMKKLAENPSYIALAKVHNDQKASTERCIFFIYKYMDFLYFK